MNYQIFFNKIDKVDISKLKKGDKVLITSHHLDQMLTKITIIDPEKGAIIFGSQRCFIEEKILEKGAVVYFYKDIEKKERKRKGTIATKIDSIQEVKKV